MSAAQSAQTDPPPNGQQQRTRAPRKAGAKTGRAKTARKTSAQTTITPTPERAAGMKQRALTHAISAGREVGNAPPFLMAALFDSLPPKGAPLAPEDAITFLNACWSNLAVSYGLKGTITIQQKAA
jgi:hypothetical protein